MIGVLNGNPEKCFPEELLNNEKNYISVQEAIGDLPPLETNRKLTSRKQPSPYQKFSKGEISVEDFEKTLQQRN